MASSRKKKAMGPEPTRLRQIALVAEDLERARHLLVYQFLSLFLDMEAEERQTTVLGTEVIYEDPAVAHWGLRNILGTFLPLSSPIPFPPSQNIANNLPSPPRWRNNRSSSAIHPPSNQLLLTKPGRLPLPSLHHRIPLPRKTWRRRLHANNAIPFRPRSTQLPRLQ
jgi:hypothetical protein